MESVKEKEITIVLKQNSGLLLKILPWNYVLLNIIKNSLCLVILSLEIVVKRDDPYGMVPWLSASMDLLE